MNTALVAGAGIGGLAAAVALARAGWRVRVFERAPEARELGFALNLAPNAIRALRELGVVDAIAAAGHRPRAVEFRGDHGRVLRRVDGGDVGADRSSVIALRAAVHGALLAAVDPSSLTFDADVIGFEQAAEGVRLRLRDGRSEAGDVLIGADGVRSAIRQQLHPGEARLRHSGYCAVRGVVHGIDSVLGALSGLVYFAPGLEAAIVRADNAGAAYWYLSLISGEPGVEALDARPVADAAAARLGDATFSAVVRTTGDQDLRFDELYDRDPIAPWGQGRVTLLGDAAHPMLPHTGQGAAQALEDAVALSLALSGEEEPASALRRYEHVRAPRTARLVRLGRRFVRVSTTRSAALGMLRAAAIRVAPLGMIMAAYQGAEGADPHAALRRTPPRLTAAGGSHSRERIT